MKIPRKPPLYDKLIRDFERNYLILEGAKKNEEEGKYRHWDILRHLTPPANLTHEEWWSGIKQIRSSTYKNIPLLNRDIGEKFSYNLTDSILEQLHWIDLNAAGAIEAPSEILNRQTSDQYIVRSLIEEAITSSQMEGAATTRQVAKELLTSGRAPRDKSERMILNNFNTMQEIRKWKNSPLSKDLIFEIHRMITDNTLVNEDAAGRFRNNSENVVVEDGSSGDVLHNPPDSEELEKRMRDMCEFANGITPNYFVHPVIRAIILHFWLAYDHPFVDGNGRTARALFYWYMLRNGYWLFEFISISHVLLKSPTNYGMAFLYTESDDNDLTYFILHQMEVIKKSIEELHKFLRKKSQEIKNIDSLIKVGTFNHRQEALIAHALRNPGSIYTVEIHKNSHRVAYDTARNDLAGLSKMGLLDKFQRGHAFVYNVPQNLTDRLQAL